ncbi:MULTISPECIES: siderophore-interacting protein [unclassified Vibrio]|uniref:Siderophore-interacting protein n=1 Tax=Vibrio sp. HB236076 TaxID=3232307 RepID=A0AB39HKC1_9VIBR|nr:siderophore-interacting protein [Vibrio sp. HB161653]MDP5252570.1 siderophore-interacting protein [Vibrio sp. HB161653]
MKKSINFTSVSVTNSVQLTENMQRITLHADAISSFPAQCEGGYIKLAFNEQGGTDIQAMLDNQQRPILRTYTIKEFHPAQGEIIVDFVRHNVEDLSGGFAARWAMTTQVGDTLSIAGPGVLDPINPQADWFFMAADMTALPALSAKIKALPNTAHGYAVIQVVDLQDKQSIESPEGIEVIWIDESESLSDTVKALPWLTGKASVWCACEFDNMRALRQYFRNDKNVERSHIYISSYWKMGVTEDGHKILKQQDAAQASPSLS